MLHPLLTHCLHFYETLSSYFQHLHLSHISTPFATITHQCVNILPAFLQERTLSTCSYLVVTMVAFLRRLPPPTPLPSVPPPPDFIKQGVFVVGQPPVSSALLGSFIGQRLSWMKRRRNVQAAGRRKLCGPPQGATDAQRHDPRARCGVCRWTPFIRRAEAVGSLPELRVWMRLMLLCCTWKDERMGEEEGKDLRAGYALRLLGRAMRRPRRTPCSSKRRRCSNRKKSCTLHRFCVYCTEIGSCAGSARLCRRWSHSSSGCGQHVCMQRSPSGHHHTLHLPPAFSNNPACSVYKQVVTWEVTVL